MVIGDEISSEDMEEDLEEDGEEEEPPITGICSFDQAISIGYDF